MISANSKGKVQRTLKATVALPAVRLAVSPEVFLFTVKEGISTSPVVEKNLPCCMASSTLCHPSLKAGSRSEEHTSELQSRLHLVCRLLLEKKKKKKNKNK